MFFINLLNFLVVNKVVITSILITLGIISFVYGIFIYSKESSTKFQLIWFLISFGFILLGILIYYNIFSKIPLIYFNIIFLLSLVLLIIFLLIEIIIISHFNNQYEKNLDYIIVLGAQIRKDGPSVILKCRLDKAIEYLNQNKNTKCIVSGGQNLKEPFEESHGMMLYMTKNKIDKNRMIIENKAKDTVQNIKNSIALLGDKDLKIGIVTNKFHLYRSLKIAKKLGLTNVYGIGARSSLFYLPHNLLREFIGVLKDKISGNI